MNRKVSAARLALSAAATAGGAATTTAAGRIAPGVARGPTGVPCTMGRLATTARFVLSHLLGHRNIKVYHGSWAEWGCLSGRPVEVP